MGIREYQETEKEEKSTENGHSGLDRVNEKERSWVRTFGEQRLGKRRVGSCFEKAILREKEKDWSREVFRES